MMTEAEYIETIRVLMAPPDPDPKKRPEQAIRKQQANRDLFEAACLNGEILTQEERRRYADLAFASAGM